MLVLFTDVSGRSVGPIFKSQTVISGGDLQSISPRRRYLTFVLVLDVEEFLRPQIVPHREHICLNDEDQSCTEVTKSVCLHLKCLCLFTLSPQSECVL